MQCYKLCLSAIHPRIIIPNSCKAGLSGTCKHTAAVLLKCTSYQLNMPFIALLGFILFSAENVDNLYFYDFRQKIYLLERLSTTNTRCYWNKEPLTSAQKKICFDLLLLVCPESSLACHM
nr:unnamed protein product [Callosobruchus analis]